MQKFLGSINDPLLLTILQQRIANQDGAQRFDFYSGDEATDQIKEEWIEFRYSRLIPDIDQFLQKKGIDIESSKLWNINNSCSIGLNLK
jgi:hypothetical protein